jgi:hypothetical protein
LAWPKGYYCPFAPWKASKPLTNNALTAEVKTITEKERDGNFFSFFGLETPLATDFHV